jgi:molybdenum transport protein
MSLPVLPDTVLAEFLADDVRLGDLTTHVLGIGPKSARMTFAARDPMVIAGAEEAVRILEMAGATVEREASSGAKLSAGATILTATGSAGALHRGWKVAQTLIEITSGIATAARRIVEAARSARPEIAVACTRKTVPGAKLLSIKAIMAGGATPHRLGLSETILVFDEHRQFLAGVAPREIVASLRHGAPEKKIVVEVATASEALTWAQAGADVLQTEKFSVDEVAATIGQLRQTGFTGLLAAAGGINAQNAAAYAQAGADILVTSAPYAAKPLDVQVKLFPA